MMDITHNQINASIAEMERISAKGQPYAKANKERQVRAVLRTMRAEQAKQPLLKDIWCYFKMWIKNLWK
jgi:hypothetical protein